MYDLIDEKGRGGGGVNILNQFLSYQRRNGAHMSLNILTLPFPTNPCNTISAQVAKLTTLPNKFSTKLPTK